jgi:acyl-CoA synthetase (AMP-forming)/AMP-acid ligase II
MLNGHKTNAGGRLAPAVVDAVAKNDPDRKFALVPNSHEVSDGFHEFTMRELAQAVNYTSWWLEKTLGQTSQPETVAYMAANDIRYAIFAFACQKTGYKVRRGRLTLF